MLSFQDKDGLRPIHQNRADLFRTFLDQAGLMDCDMKGCKFAWSSNPRDGVVTKEKIDRVLFNWVWRFQHPHAIAIALPTVGSDHSPIVLYSSPKAKSGTSFKFEAYWEEHDDCNRIIEEGWNGDNIADPPWQKLLIKSKTCTKSLQRWHKNTFKRADREITQLKGRLKFLLNQGSAHSDMEEISRVKGQIDRLWKQEEAYWGQRSRLKWIKWGDRNTNFFHATTIQRRGRNRIQRLRSAGGSWIEGQDNLFNEILTHYREVYQTQPGQHVNTCLSFIPSFVTPEINDVLLQPISIMEIKRAVDGLGALKSPGPDGLNGLLYQNHWEVVQDDVCNAVTEFFQQGMFPSEINETIVSLIPKVQSLESVS